MKYLFLPSVMFVVCVVFQSNALADTKFEVARIHPPNGEPMVVKDFNLPYDWEIEGRWNKQGNIRIPVKKVKSIQVLQVLPEGDYKIEAELTMKNGEKTIINIKETNRACTAETPFGEMTISIADIGFIDLNPDLSEHNPVVTAVEKEF